MIPLMTYNSLQQKQWHRDSIWPSSSQHSEATSRQVPVLTEQTISSCSDPKLLTHRRLWLFLPATLASGPITGPFPCMTTNLMREKKNCCGKKHVFHFLTLAALSSQGPLRATIEQISSFHCESVQKEKESCRNTHSLWNQWGQRITSSS